jgi:hypothetical protein
MRFVLMNFFAHYLCLPENHTEHEVLGNLMPDIYPGFSVFYNSVLRYQNPDENKQKLLLNGVRFHLKADELFHQHPLFTESSNTATSLLSKAAIFPRSWVVGHVMTELLIDKHLLNENTDCAGLFYQSLIQASESLPEGLIYLEPKSQRFTKFLLNFRSFLQNRYLYRLGEPEGVKEAVCQIFGSRFSINFTPTMIVELQEIIDETDFLIKKDVLQQMQDIKQQLNS